MALRDEVCAAFGVSLHALYLYGAVTFPESEGTGDLDYHAILTGPPDPDQRTGYAAACARLAGLPGCDDLDGWVIELAQARGSAPPVHRIRPGLRDDAWALHRAHWLAGRCVVLHGPPPASIVGQPGWDEQHQGLAAEFRFAQADKHDAYAVLNCCRILRSLAEHDVVQSKFGSAWWALDYLPIEHASAVTAAMNSYRGRATVADVATMAAPARDRRPGERGPALTGTVLTGTVLTGTVLTGTALTGTALTGALRSVCAMQGAGRSVLTRYAVAWFYLAATTAAEVVYIALPHPDRAALLRWASTNVHNLGHDPVGSLIASAFVPTSSLSAWPVLIALALFGANRALGNWRIALTCLAGNVIGTYVSEGVIWYRISHGTLPATDRFIIDVGPSYVVVSAVAVAILYGTWLARLAAALDLVLLITVGQIFAGLTGLRLTAVGHVTALGVGATLGGFLAWQRRRRETVSCVPQSG